MYSSEMISLLGKLKDHWGDKVYAVCDQVNMDVPVYIIKNQLGQRQTLHQN